MSRERCNGFSHLVSGARMDCDLPRGHAGDHRFDFGEGHGPIFWPALPASPSSEPPEGKE